MYEMKHGRRAIISLQDHRWALKRFAMRIYKDHVAKRMRLVVVFDVIGINRAALGGSKVADVRRELLF